MLPQHRRVQTAPGRGAPLGSFNTSNCTLESLSSWQVLEAVPKGRWYDHLPGSIPYSFWKKMNMDYWSYKFRISPSVQSDPDLFIAFNCSTLLFFFLEHDWNSIGIYNWALKIVFNRNHLHWASEYNFRSFFFLFISCRERGNRGLWFSVVLPDPQPMTNGIELSYTR